MGFTGMVLMPFNKELLWDIYERIRACSWKGSGFVVCRLYAMEGLINFPQLGQENSAYFNSLIESCIFIKFLIIFGQTFIQRIKI